MKRCVRALGIVTALAVMLSTAVAKEGGPSASPQVATSSGTVRGAAADGVNVFRGIPYAHAPVGDMRWRPPQPVKPWTDVRSAAEFGPACPQPARNDNARRADGLGAAPPVQSEDCLYLNVWTPGQRASLPVMVWIHGGAHRFGASSLPFYDGAALAKQGVVLVSINYRLGFFGYFAHPTLSAAARSDEPVGNYGAMDQLAALQWVQQNIAAFGGDPRNVTVFGESAGGASILYLLSMDAAKGLFAKAIVESGGGWQRALSLTQKEQEGVKAVTSVGLGQDATLASLRSLSVDDLNRAIGVAPLLNFGPFIDGRLITASPGARFGAGQAIDVPLIIGWNSNEASLIDATGATPASLLRVYPERQLQELREVYRSEATGDEALAKAVFSDVSFAAPARWIAARAQAGAPSWLYHFDYTLQVRRNAPGANHAAEIPFVFATLDNFPALQRLISARDRAMATTMSGCWVAFARTGKPACDGAPAWPAYDPQRDTLMKFGVPTETLTNFRKKVLDFQDTSFASRPGGAL